MFFIGEQMPIVFKSFTKDTSEADILSKLDQIPTLPTISFELGKVINNPMSSIKDVERLMVNDQGLTMKVLRLANSSYYAIPGGCTTLSRAITYLGFDTVHQLVLSMSIFQTLKNASSNDDLNIKQLWVHAVGVAVAAEEIANFTNYKQPSDLFTCGLLHDIGKVAQVVIDPKAVSRIVGRAKLEGTNYFKAEHGENLRTHSEIGFMLAKRWNLPHQIQSAIRWHHELDTTKRVPILPENNRIVDITMLANLITISKNFGNSGHNQETQIPPELLVRLGITENAVQTISANFDKSIKKAGSFLDIVLKEL